MVRVPGLGPGGRRFESFHPDHRICSLKIVVELAQLVRALVCGTGGRGFESHIPPHDKKRKNEKIYTVRPWLNWIEYRTSDPTVIGSNPIGRTKNQDASLAQLDRAMPF